MLETTLTHTRSVLRQPLTINHIPPYAMCYAQIQQLLTKHATHFQVRAISGWLCGFIVSRLGRKSNEGASIFPARFQVPAVLCSCQGLWHWMRSWKQRNVSKCMRRQHLTGKESMECREELCSTKLWCGSECIPMGHPMYRHVSVIGGWCRH